MSLSGKSNLAAADRRSKSPDQAHSRWLCIHAKNGVYSCSAVSRFCDHYIVFAKLLGKSTTSNIFIFSFTKFLFDLVHIVFAETKLILRWEQIASNNFPRCTFSLNEIHTMLGRCILARHSHPEFDTAT